MAEQIELRGVDPKHLIEFFEANDQPFMVLRVVDLFDLIQDDLHWLIRQVAAEKLLLLPGLEGRTQGWEKRWLLNKFPMQYIVISYRDFITPMEFVEVKRLQGILVSYREIRMGKAFPTRTDICEKCNGTGKQGRSDCQFCDGTGKLEIYMELSEEEKKLAKEGPV